MSLPPVVVTATRTEESPFDLPFSVDVLDSHRLINEKLSRTLPESLDELRSVMVQKTAHGQGSPYIRGFTGFRTLLMIDGIRLNNSVMREGPNQYWNTVDPLTIEQLELVRGPSSVLYGSDAIGGTVNAVTQRRAIAGDGFDGGGRVYYRVASAENAHIGRVEYGGSVDEHWGFLLGGSIKSFGDLVAGDGTGKQPQTGYDEYDLDGKLEYFLTPDSWLVLAHQHVDQNDVPRTHRTVAAKSFRGTAIGTDLVHELDQNRDLTYLQYHGRDLNGLVDSIHASLSYHNQQEERWRVRGNGRGDRQGFDVDTLGVSVQLETPSPVGTWTYGAEYYRDWVDSFRRDYNADGSLNSVAIQGPVADDARYDLVGVFLQDQLPVGERVELIPGTRLTHARVTADSVADPVSGLRTSLQDDWTSLVGSGRVLVRIDEQDRWHWFGGVSQGFRAPNLSDLTAFDVARSGELETPAPGLDPEEFVTFETGLKHRSERWSAELAYYYTFIEDLIVRVPTGNIVNGNTEVTKRNAGDGYIHGLELSGRVWVHPQVSAFGWISWMEGEAETYPTAAPVTRDEYLSRLMPLSGELGLRWEHPQQRLWAELVLVMADGQNKLSSGDKRDTQRIPPGGTPGYAVVSLRGGWNITPLVRVSAAVENLADKNYRVHGSGVNEPGRNFVLTADIRF